METKEKIKFDSYEEAIGFKEACRYFDIDIPVWVIEQLESSFKEEYFKDKANLPLKMTIEDVFDMKKRGVVAYGLIKSGTVNVGDKIGLCGNGVYWATVTGVSKHQSIQDEGHAGEEVGLLLAGITKSDVKVGMRIRKSEDIITLA